MNFQDPLPHTSITSATPHRTTPAQTRRVVLITAIAVLAVLGGLYGFNRLRASGMKAYFAANKPPVLAMSTEVVATSDIPQDLSAIGSIAAVHQVMISAEVGGKVARIAFQAGTEVKKGALLVQLNDATEQADLALARAQMKLSKVGLDRARALTERGFSAQSQLDQAQNQFDAAAAGVTRNEALIAQKQVRAPFDGALGVRQIEVGQYLEPGANMVMLTDVGFLYVDFTLPEQARPQLAQGQNIALTVDAYPGRTFIGRLYVIDPQIAQDTRTIKLQAVVDNHDRLLMAGMFAKVKVALPPRTNVMTVPETALDHTLYGDSVFVAQAAGNSPDGKLLFKLARTAVQAGERFVGRVAVTGLKPGDRVVTAGQSKVFDGDIASFFDAPEGTNGNGVWAGLDLGEGKDAAVTKIRYYPRADFPARLHA